MQCKLTVVHIHVGTIQKRVCITRYTAAGLYRVSHYCKHGIAPPSDDLIRFAQRHRRINELMV